MEGGSFSALRDLAGSLAQVAPSQNSGRLPSMLGKLWCGPGCSCPPRGVSPSTFPLTSAFSPPHHTKEDTCTTNLRYSF